MSIKAENSSPNAKTSPAGRPFYLLVEESARELAARILVAQPLLERGATVWIGAQNWIVNNADKLVPGVMLFKGNNLPQVEFMQRVKRAGHATASLEEEIFGLTGDLGARIYDRKVAETCDLFLAQGAAQKAHACSYLGVPDEKVVVTGNPRADLLRAPYRARHHSKRDAIRREHGPFLLVNSNFGATNPFDGDAFSFFQRGVAMKVFNPDNPESLQGFLDICALEKANLKALVETIAELQRRTPDRKITIRPHPSENVERWKQAYQNSENVEVILDGDHLSWILASDALLHTSCTTGLEAALLDHPVVGLLPAPENQWSAKYLSNRVVNTVASPGEAADELLSGQAIPKLSSDFSRYLSVSDDSSAAEMVAEALASLSVPEASRSMRYSPDFQSFRPTERQAAQLRYDEGSFRSLYQELISLSPSTVSADITSVSGLVFRLQPRDGDG